MRVVPARSSAANEVSEDCLSTGAAPKSRRLRLQKKGPYGPFGYVYPGEKPTFSIRRGLRRYNLKVGMLRKDGLYSNACQIRDVHQ